mmetsp:Transcript_4638/g.9311  ORF Transcript_4638/g.9311 Transcript_4638/m.9311 type:complete len:264 (-) Transcript_4638:1110-1901(-)
MMSDQRRSRRRERIAGWKWGLSGFAFGSLSGGGLGASTSVSISLSCSSSCPSESPRTRTPAPNLRSLERKCDTKLWAVSRVSISPPPRLSLSLPPSPGWGTTSACTTQTEASLSSAAGGVGNRSWMVSGESWRLVLTASNLLCARERSEISCLEEPKRDSREEPSVSRLDLLTAARSSPCCDDATTFRRCVPQASTRWLRSPSTAATRLATDQRRTSDGAAGIDKTSGGPPPFPPFSVSELCTSFCGCRPAEAPPCSSLLLGI